jgi:hypothetical protein
LTEEGIGTETPLGRPIRTHAARRGLRRGFAGFAILAGAGTLIAAVLAVWRWQYAYQHFGPAAVLRWTAPYAAGAGALALLALVALARLLGLRGASVLTFRHGIVYRKGRLNRSIPWRDIRLTYTTALSYAVLGLGWRRKQELLLVLSDGARVRLDSRLEDIDELADTVKEHVYPELLAEYTDIFARGRDLPFGPLRLSHTGVRHGRRGIAWPQMGEVKFERGGLVLAPKEDTRGATIRVSAQQVPNVELCAQLIERFGRQL